MRATISFEADVSRVNDIMRSLVLEESNALQDAFICLEKATADRIVEGVSEALDQIYTVANQLEQYRSMMISFEQARFETILPQSAPARVDVSPAGTPATAIPEQLLTSLNDMKKAVGDMEQFDGFLEKISLPAVTAEEETDDSEDR